MNFRWDNPSYGKWVLVADNGQIIGEVTRHYDGTCTTLGRRWINLESAKRAVEKRIVGLEHE